MWKEDMVEFKSGEFSLIYQGRYSNFRDANNLVDRIRTGVYKARLQGTKLFTFT